MISTNDQYFIADSQVTASKLQTDKGSTSNKRRQNCEQEMAATSATINYCNNQA